MLKQSELAKKALELEKIISYEFNDKEILYEALTHPSVTVKSNNKRNYQRLEFLGNSILGAILADIIYKSFPSADEGKLSVIQSKMASTAGIVAAVQEISIGEYILFDIGEFRNGGMHNHKHIEDCVEAIIGGIYLDGGYDAAKEFVKKFWLDKILSANDLDVRDAKSRLQEFCQKESYPLPEYAVRSQQGQMHSPTFTIECVVIIDGQIISAAAKGKKKKTTEQEAAANMIKILSSHYSNL